MQTISQTIKIKRRLEKGQSITPLEALNRYGCMRLGARILELKRQGMTIYSRMITRSGKRVAEYSAVPFKGVVLLAVDLNQQIGDMELQWIAWSCLFLIAFWAVSFAVLSRRVRRDKKANVWPSRMDVLLASPDRLRRWVIELPFAKTEDEYAILKLIIKRHMEARKASELQAEYRYAETAKLDDECLITTEY